MNEKEFKEHLKELAHGKHNLAEHDWNQPQPGKKTATPKPRSKSRRKTRTA